ncbi:hypothetical protein SMICM17S_00243 [Streptomyces microflavus]
MVELRVSRWAIWGAARAMNAIGPTAAVTSAVSATPTTVAVSRARWAFTPSARAVSSPISRWTRGRTTPTEQISRAAKTSAVTRSCSKPSPLREPAPQVATSIAWCGLTARSSIEVIELRNAPTAIPTMMSRKGRTPPR